MEIAYRRPEGPAQKNWRWVCRPCVNKRQRELHKTPARQKAKQRYREENAEAIAVRKSEWAKADRLANPEKHKEKARQDHEALMADPVRHAVKLAKQRRNDREKLVRLKQDSEAYEQFLEAERERTRLRYQRNKETHLSRSKRSHYKQKYGITLEQLRELWVEQDCSCALCQAPLEDPTAERVRHRTGTWHLDHCHDTGQIRGLLCNRCNMALGLLGDSTGRLEAAIQYLNESALGAAA
jgi:hypothetical protein